MTGFGSRVRILAGSAIWAGAVWGALEGAVLVIGRAFPAIQAAHKVPPAALWIAPWVQSALFLVSAGPLAALTGWWPGGRFGYRHGLGLFSGLGAGAILIGPGLLHWAAVLVLGMAAGVAVFRAVPADLSPRATAILGRGWIPAVAVALLTGLTTASERLIERRREAATPSSLKADAPDVLILILDTVRRDRWHDGGGGAAGGGAPPLMPSLIRRAQGGIVFSNAWSAASWSLPSQASILTGRIPQHHRADWPAFKLADSVPTLAEYFRARGYATGAFSSNDSWITPEYLGRGFSRFRTYRLGDVWRRTSGGRLVGRALQLFGWRGDSPSKPMETTTGEFLAFVAENPKRPVFGYLCYMDVNRAFYDQQLSHPSWRPRPSIEGGIAAYDGALSRLDSEIERLLVELERRGRLTKTILVVASDHGESFGESTGDHDPRGHGTSLYPEQVRVPLTIIAPGRLPAGATVAHPVVLTDLAGFVVRLTGGDDHAFPARDLLRPPAEGESPGLFLSLDYAVFSARSIVADNLQYIWNRGKANPPEELFDLTVDPLARHNIAASHPGLGDFRDLVRRADPADRAR